MRVRNIGFFIRFTYLNCNFAHFRAYCTTIDIFIGPFAFSYSRTLMMTPMQMPGVLEELSSFDRSWWFSWSRVIYYGVKIADNSCITDGIYVNVQNETYQCNWEIRRAEALLMIFKFALNGGVSILLKPFGTLLRLHFFWFRWVSMFIQAVELRECCWNIMIIQENDVKRGLS